MRTIGPAIVATLILLAAQQSQAADCLWAVNHKRASRGLYPLLPDANLQAWAQRKADMQARQGRMGHIYRGPWPGRAEGVGYVSHRDPQGRSVLACTMTTRRHRYAGAACSVDRRGRTYYTIIYR